MSESTCVLLHNPRCSKSRDALSLLEQHGKDLHVRRYLEQPLDADELRLLIQQLPVPAAALIRAQEAQAAGFAPAGETPTDDEVVAWLVDHPQTMQRPVVIYGDRAVIARPPVHLLTLFDD